MCERWWVQWQYFLVLELNCRRTWTRLDNMKITWDGIQMKSWLFALCKNIGRRYHGYGLLAAVCCDKWTLATETEDKLEVSIWLFSQSSPKSNLNIGKKLVWTHWDPTGTGWYEFACLCLPRTALTSESNCWLTSRKQTRHFTLRWLRNMDWCKSL